MERIVIAVDGPSGAGKSTVSKIIAEKFGITYIDTGAMYRAVALKSKEMGLPVEDERALAEVAEGANISFDSRNGKNLTILDGRDVSSEIRMPDISMLTSQVSALPSVRTALVSLQRDMARTGSVILDGRDIGTVVFPDADLKFFLDASLEARAGRRYMEEKVKDGFDGNLQKTIKATEERDRADSTRAEAPLVKAEDAIYVDTTGLSQSDVVDKVEEIVKSFMKRVKQD